MIEGNHKGERVDSFEGEYTKENIDAYGKENVYDYFTFFRIKEYYILIGHETMLVLDTKNNEATEFYTR